MVNKPFYQKGKYIYYFKSLNLGVLSVIGPLLYLFSLIKLLEQHFLG